MAFGSFKLYKHGPECASSYGLVWKVKGHPFSHSIWTVLQKWLSSRPLGLPLVYKLAFLYQFNRLLNMNFQAEIACKECVNKYWIWLQDYSLTLLCPTCWCPEMGGVNTNTVIILKQMKICTLTTFLKLWSTEANKSSQVCHFP